MPPMTLNELAERVERAEGPDRALDGEIAVRSGLYVYEKRDRDRNTWYYPADGVPGWRRAIHGIGGERLPSFTASLDAAMTLVPEGHVWTLYSDGCAGVAPRRDDDDLADASTWAATPALALCIAALRARAREEG